MATLFPMESRRPLGRQLFCGRMLDHATSVSTPLHPPHRYPARVQFLRVDLRVHQALVRCESYLRYRLSVDCTNLRCRQAVYVVPGSDVSRPNRIRLEFATPICRCVQDHSGAVSEERTRRLAQYRGCGRCRAATHAESSPTTGLLTIQRRACLKLAQFAVSKIAEHRLMDREVCAYWF